MPNAEIVAGTAGFALLPQSERGRGKMRDMIPSRPPQRTPELPLSDDLARFRRGELTLDEYLDARVEAAVAHFRRVLSEEQLQVVRDVLRETLQTDPSLQTLVQQLVSDREASAYRH